MNPFFIIKRSLSYRTAHVYKKSILRSLKPIVVDPDRSSANLVYVNICGKAHLDLLIVSLHSLFKTWTSIPQIKIYSDGSISPDEMQKRLQYFFKIPIEVLSWESCIEELTEPDDYLVVDFAKCHIMGKKFMVMLCNGRKQPTLWCDSDVLWYKNLDIKYPNDKFFLKASVDCQPSYSESMASHYPELHSKPFINAGVLCINGNLLKQMDFKPLLKVAIAQPDHFSEQTMVAITVHKTGLNLWPEKEVVCFESDKNTLMPSFINKQWVARHYVGPVRHLFWRDAFFFNLKGWR